MFKKNHLFTYQLYQTSATKSDSVGFFSHEKNKKCCDYCKIVFFAVHPISIKFVCLCEFRFREWSHVQNSKFHKFNIADGRQLGNGFAVILYQRHIVRLTRNLDRWSRIARKYRSRDQNCKFRKLKMVDGRQIKKGYVVTVCLRRFSFDFNEIWYADANFDSENGRVTKNWNQKPFYESKMADGHYLGNCCSAIFQRHIVQLMQNLERWSRIARRHPISSFVRHCVFVVDLGMQDFRKIRKKRKH